MYFQGWGMVKHLFGGRYRAAIKESFPELVLSEQWVQGVCVANSTT
jgi:hypothetical protein